MTVLDDIVAGVREDLAVRQSRTSRAELDAAVAAAPAPCDALASLRAHRGVGVISEVKRRSPSKGSLADIPDPASLAAAYAAGGASVISVLTEERRFGGSLADLDAVSAAVRIPVLRKDFTVDEWMVSEARAHGADLILLIVAALDDAQLRDLHDQARELGMHALVEVHDAPELERALAIDPAIVGVNARNLKTLEIDTGIVHGLLPQIPAEVLRVAESGVAGPEDVAEYVRHGADAVLVGEALVTGGRPTQAVTEFIATGARARGQQPGKEEQHG